MEAKDPSDLNQDPELQLKIINNLKQFKGQSELRRASLNIFVKMCQPKEYDRISSQFKSIDKDGTGFIEVDELRKVLANANFSKVLSQKEIEDIIKQIDNDDNGKINYSEFIAATIDIRKYLTRARVEAIFKSFDVDDDEMITDLNLKNAFTKLGKDISDQEIRHIF